MRNRRFIQIATIVIVALVAVAFLANRALPSSPGSIQPSSAPPEPPSYAAGIVIL